jgi:hypothetical protein
MALCLLPCLQKQAMNKILIGALVCAAVAGVVFYLYNTEEGRKQLDDLKDKATDALSKAKSNMSKRAADMQTWAES